MTIADRLAIAAEQLEYTSEQARGLTADDVRALAPYLHTLAEHGWRMCELALQAIEQTVPGHPTRGAPHGTDMQVCLQHAANLFDAVLSFAFEAEAAAAAMNQGETTS